LAEGEQEQMKGHDGLEDQEKKARNNGRIVVLCGEDDRRKGRYRIVEQTFLEGEGKVDLAKGRMMGDKEVTNGGDVIRGGCGGLE